MITTWKKVSLFFFLFVFILIVIAISLNIIGCKAIGRMKLLNFPLNAQSISPTITHGEVIYPKEFQGDVRTLPKTAPTSPPPQPVLEPRSSFWDKVPLYCP